MPRERPLGLVADYEIGPLFAAVPPSQGVYQGRHGDARGRRHDQRAVTRVIGVPG